MKDPDSIIEDFMVSAYNIKDDNKIDIEYLRKVWLVDYVTVKRKLGVTSKSCARMDNYSLIRSYSLNGRKI